MELRERLADKDTRIRFMVCVDNRGYEMDLNPLRVYAVLPPEPNEADLPILRVIDESGEDYLYPDSYFAPVELDEGAKRTLTELMKNRLEA